MNFAHLFQRVCELVCAHRHFLQVCQGTHNSIDCFPRMIAEQERTQGRQEGETANTSVGLGRCIHPAGDISRHIQVSQSHNQLPRQRRKRPQNRHNSPNILASHPSSFRANNSCHSGQAAPSIHAEGGADLIENSDRRIRKLCNVCYNRIRRHFVCVASVYR